MAHVSLNHPKLTLEGAEAILAAACALLMAMSIDAGLAPSMRANASK